MLNKFKEYLINKKLSKTSIKNYISDVRQFMNWSANNSVDYTSVTSYINYRLYLLGQKLPTNSINRHLASLRTFGIFLQSEKLLMLNPAMGLENISNDTKTPIKPINEEQILLNKFRQSLTNEHLKAATIKNYLSDVGQFIKFVKTNGQ